MQTKFDINEIKDEQSKDPIIQNKIKEVIKYPIKQSFIFNDCFIIQGSART